MVRERRRRSPARTSASTNGVQCDGSTPALSSFRMSASPPIRRWSRKSHPTPDRVLASGWAGAKRRLHQLAEAAGRLRWRGLRAFLRPFHHAAAMQNPRLWPYPHLDMSGKRSFACWSAPMADRLSPTKGHWQTDSCNRQNITSASLGESQQKSALTQRIVIMAYAMWQAVRRHAKHHVRQPRPWSRPAARSSAPPRSLMLSREVGVLVVSACPITRACAPRAVVGAIICRALLPSPAQRQEAQAHDVRWAD